MLVENVTQDQLTKDFSWNGDKHLRPYQLDGVNWLLGCYNKNHGCILGDEMGLGKTCQTIALLSITSGSVSNQPHMVVCPRSVLENWEKEFERFSPKFCVKVYIGDKEHRANIAHEIKKCGDQFPFDVLLTTYEMCLKDYLFFQSIDWNVLVVDEAHRLKNHESLLYTTLKQWDIKMKVLLTGTPVQNNLRELYSLLSFLDKKTFRISKLDQFVEKYSNENQDIKELLEVMEPYLLRRTKSQVLMDLPEKTDIVLYHGLSALQKKLYKAILTKDIGVFETNTSAGSQPRLMNILMQLRKCVNHPYLFDGVEEEPFVLGEHLVEASNKLCLIDRLLDTLKQAGHKVLMFSQMTRMLDILQDYLGYRGYIYERLDGSVRGEERFLAVQNFNENEDTFVFLLSTKAGGQGLNLTSADTVIFVDSDFNPQNDLQAAARAHRIGQDRPVKIIRLLGRNTVEEIILRRAEEKLRLTEKVIESGHFASCSKTKKVLGGEKPSQLQEILKFGVDELLSESKSDDTSLDFEKILGPSEEGRWMTDTSTTSQRMDSSPPTQEEEEEDKSVCAQGEGGGGVGAGPSQSMYVFEGTDYSKEPSAADLKAFDQLLQMEREVMETQAQGEKNLRKSKTSITGFFPLPGSKPRKQLTPEQLQERTMKLKETAERKAKLAEERKAERAEKQRQKKEKLWQENGYMSTNVLLSAGEQEGGDEGEEDELTVFFDSDSDDNDDDDDDDDDANGDGGDAKEEGRREHGVKDQPKKLRIQYAMGDVTRPKGTPGYENIVVHCVDDCGSWGRGGVFSALAMCSGEVKAAYEMAGRMDDLSLGDCHLVDVTDSRSSPESRFWVALLVVQQRNRQNRLSGIDLSSLQQGLRKVCQAAKEKHASVHLPRIGHDTPNFNWYATERLIRKYLANQGVPTSIYYFPRRTGGTKRRNGGAPATTSLPTKVPKGGDGASSSLSSSSSSSFSNVVTVSTSPAITSSISTPNTTSNKKKELSSLFTRTVVYFHNLEPDQKKKLTRLVLAYDGDIDKVLTDSTTHVVTCDTTDKKVLSELVSSSSVACPVVVSEKWLEACVSKGRCLDCDEFLMLTT